MLADERLQLTHDVSVASQGQVGIDPVGDSRNPQLVQPPDRGLGKRLVMDIGEGRTAPHAQRTAQRACGIGGLIAGELSTAGLRQRLEPVSVHPADGQSQRISPGDTDDDVRRRLRHGARAARERPPEPGNRQLEGVARILRWPVRPQRFRGHIG